MNCLALIDGFALPASAVTKTFDEGDAGAGTPTAAVQMISDAVLASLEACPRDCRRELLQNIYLAGGHLVQLGERAEIASQVMSQVQTGMGDIKTYVGDADADGEGVGVQVKAVLPKEFKYAAWIGGSGK